LDSDGIGLSGLAPTVVPYFILSTQLDSNLTDLIVKSNDSTSIDASPTVHGDTLFVHHNSPFPSNSSISVKLEGVDKNGKRVNFSLTGSEEFNIGQSLHAIASNTWRASAGYRTEFSLYDTIWVQFSAPLDTNRILLQWSAPSPAML